MCTSLVSYLHRYYGLLKYLSLYGSSDQALLSLAVGKLASLEDFQTQKDELMFQMESLKEQLEQQKQEHQTVLYNLEKKAVLDNYRSVP